MRLRIRTLAWLLLAGVALLPAQASAPQETLEQLIAKAAVTHDKQAEAYANVARREVEVANDYFSAGAADKAHAAVDDAVTYAEKSLEAARKTHKRLKEADMILHRTSRRLNDVNMTLAFEDRRSVKAAANRIEDIRLQVLNLLFAPPEKKK
jgi:hypothetical protein